MLSLLVKIASAGTVSFALKAEDFVFKDKLEISGDKGC